VAEELKGLLAVGHHVQHAADRVLAESLLDYQDVAPQRYTGPVLGQAAGSALAIH